MNREGETQVAIFDVESRHFTVKKLSSYLPQKGEVVVRVTCCTICGSDLHTYCGRRLGPSPSVLGHEIIGTVEAWLGDPRDYFGNPLTLGQRITWCLSVGCGECSRCRQGLPQKCESLFKYGHSSFDGGRSTGGLAEHCVLVAGTPIFPVPDSLPNTVVCPANCATATVMAAVRLVNELRPLESARVLVTGLGMLGLTACAVCSESGCREVCAVDIKSARRDLAASFGAHQVLCPDQLQDPEYKGHFDVALEFSGAGSAMEAGVASLAVGGILVLVGSVFPGQTLTIDPEHAVRSMLTLRGIHNYRPDDLAAALQFLEESGGLFPFEELVSQPYSLNETNEAFQAAMEDSAIRVAIEPGR